MTDDDNDPLQEITMETVKPHHYKVGDLVTFNADTTFRVIKVIDERHVDLIEVKNK